MSRSFDISISSVWDTKSQTHTQMPMSLRYRLLMLMMLMCLLEREATAALGSMALTHRWIS